MNDPYLDPQSGILRNKFGLTYQKELDNREANAVGVRSVMLQLNPVAGNFDSRHLKAIHEYLFRDVYDWAGTFRTISLSKRDLFGGRVTHFSSPDAIEAELEAVFCDLAKHNFLRSLPRRVFANQLAQLFSEINRIHPFREGNGRAQRQFIRQLAQGNYKPHFDVVSKERLVMASIASAHGDMSMMQRMMDEITDTERIQPLKKLIGFFDKNNYEWNDRYIATTTPGQEYRGTFAQTAGKDFFFYDEHNRILVGKTSDLRSEVKARDKIAFEAS